MYKRIKLYFAALFTFEELECLEMVLGMPGIFYSEMFCGLWSGRGYASDADLFERMSTALVGFIIGLGIMFFGGMLFSLLISARILASLWRMLQAPIFVRHSII